MTECDDESLSRLQSSLIGRQELFEHWITSSQYGYRAWKIKMTSNINKYVQKCVQQNIKMQN